MREAIQKWWEGEFVPYDNNMSSGAVFVVGGEQRRHWTATVARYVLEFLQREWKWVIGFMMSAIALWIAYLKL